MNLAGSGLNLFQACLLFSSNIDIDLLPLLDNQSVWQNSYTYYKKSIRPCLTFDPPLEKLIYPQDAFVSQRINNRKLV